MMETELPDRGTNETRPRESRPTIAVVTGSGGIKAFAAIELFQFLEDAQIVPDLLLGCSGGAIMAGLYATGYTPARMRELIPELMKPELVSKIDYRSLLGIPGLPFGRFDLTRGIIKPAGIRSVQRQLFGKARLEDLRPKTLIQVTDYYTGEGYAMDRGDLADVVYASGALYPVLPPIRIDDRWLVDGAFSSPCPVIEAVLRQIDVIIALTIETRLNEEPATLMELFNYAPSLCSAILMKNQMAAAINLHHHEIIRINVCFTRPVEFWHLDAIPLVMETGRLAVEAKKEEILSAIRNFHDDHPSQTATSQSEAIS